MNITTFQAEDIIAQAKKKIVDFNSIKELLCGNSIFTKGVFDLLHYGHLSLFEYLNMLKGEHGFPIVVAVTNDALVQEKKGSNRPINRQSDRAIQIALLSQIDYVFINDQSNLSILVSELMPRFFVKGVDTAGSLIDKESLVAKNPEFAKMEVGSTVVIFSDNQSVSTSDLIKIIVEKS